MATPSGLALYFRHIRQSKHGTPKQLATRCKNLGLSWVALGGPWQEKRKSGRVEARAINSADTCRRYSEALEGRGIVTYVWGYPWQGGEAEFTDMLLACAGPGGRVLLDAELGSNPVRASKGAGKKQADEHARELVARVRDGGAREVGLSTFGVVPRWYPLRAFLKAGVDFAGGQTYTDDKIVPRSLKTFESEVERFGNGNVQLVPNFGLYTWQKKTGGKRRARPKTAVELRAHVMRFVEAQTPVHSMIGWAENFVNGRLGDTLPDLAEVVQRGATALPTV